MQALGLHDLGRRAVAHNDNNATVTVEARLGKLPVELVMENFTTPLTTAPGQTTLAVNGHGEPLVVRAPLGKGVAYVIGGFIARTYYKRRNVGFEQFMEHLCRDAGAERAFDVASRDGCEALAWRSGVSGDSRLLWIMNSGPHRTVNVTDNASLFGQADKAVELTTGKSVELKRSAESGRCSLDINEGAFAILKW